VCGSLIPIPWRREPDVPILECEKAMTQQEASAAAADEPDRVGLDSRATDPPGEGDAAPTVRRRVARRLPVEIASSLLAGRWTVPILWRLFWGGRRFHQLRRSIGAISQGALAAALGEMERRGVVGRRFPCGASTAGEYQLTELGRSLRPVLGAMHEWGLFVMSLPGEQQRALEEIAPLETGGTGMVDADGSLQAQAAVVGASVRGFGEPGRREETVCLK